MMESGITYAILTAIALGVWTFSHDMVANELNNAMLSAILVSFFAVIIGFFSYTLINTDCNIVNFTKIFSISHKGLFFLLLAGAMALCIDLFAVKAYQSTAEVSLIAPIIMSGGVLVSTLIGVIILGESITLYKILGSGAVVIGIVFLSI